ncbi:glycosyltransferase [Pedobacter fastidiosus]
MFKAFYLGELLSPDLSIYYSRDYMLGVDYWKKHGTRLEPLLIAKNNICFANSIYLTEYCKHYNKNSFYVGQGCDIEDFKNSSNFKRPVDLPTGKTIIGYVGALNSIRLDLDIIEHIAIKFPEYLIVLVGPEDEVFLSSMLHEIDNIVFLGQKEVKQLAEYINAFDICINPQLVNPVTIGNYPRKIDEYLALGKPTIATATKTMEAFKDYVYLAQDKEDYIKFIQYALANNNDKLESERKDFAYTHTWKNSVDEMRKQIEIILKTA